MVYPLSALMAPFLFLLLFLSEAASDLNMVTVPGDDVILPCQADDPSIRVVEWIRPDLEPPEYVLYYSEGHLDPTHQHPSFKDRVELVDRDLKDGDVSLILKNVSRHDAGTYKCRVITDDSGRTKRDTNSDPISIIRLQVSDQIVVTVPGDNVILSCQADDSSIRAVEWTRPDLKPDTVLLYRDGHLNTTDQNPSFKGRVELVDRDLKDRDVSLILKNVNKHDAGTYNCRVKTGDTDPIRTIRTVRLLVPDLILVAVPGNNVTLPCQAADSSIRVVKWTRPDLKQDIVLLYSDGDLNTTHQHPSFKGRVELVDRDLKDGDVSLILKNVSSIDNGTYECRVEPAASRRRKRSIIDSEPIRIIRLQVTEPGSEDGDSFPGGRYRYLGLAAGVLVLVAVAVVGVLMYKRHKDKRSGQHMLVRGVFVVDMTHSFGVGDLGYIPTAIPTNVSLSKTLNP